MPRLYVLSGPDVGRSYAVDDGSVLGRARDCDVALRGASVSRHHARVERDGAALLTRAQRASVVPLNTNARARRAHRLNIRMIECES